MATWRFLPPANAAAAQNLTFLGRNYTKTPGGALDVPDFDGPIMRANGWILLGPVGTTAQRPTTMPTGAVCYIDTTVNKPIFHDGAAWRDHAGSTV